jgi:hypothetical protein
MDSNHWFREKLHEALVPTGSREFGKDHDIGVVTLQRVGNSGQPRSPLFLTLP